MKFYEVEPDYLEYLRNYESKVPYIQYENRNQKFFCGIVLEIDGFKFYAPVSSNKDKKYTDYPMYSNQKSCLGTIRFAYMVPVPNNQLKVKDFSKVPDEKYRSLLNKQWNFCKHKRNQIQKKAEIVYNGVVKNENKPRFASACCDFELLMKKCKEYDE